MGYFTAVTADCVKKCQAVVVLSMEKIVVVELGFSEQDALLALPEQAEVKGMIPGNWNILFKFNTMAVFVIAEFFAADTEVRGAESEML